MCADAFCLFCVANDITIILWKRKDRDKHELIGNPGFDTLFWGESAV